MSCAPARPAGLPAAARTALLVPSSAAPLPSAPQGLPKRKTAVSPAPTFWSLPHRRQSSEAAIRQRKSNRPQLPPQQSFDDSH